VRSHAGRRSAVVEAGDSPGHGLIEAPPHESENRPQAVLGSLTTLQHRVHVFSSQSRPQYAWGDRLLDSLHRRVCSLRQCSLGGQARDRRMAHVVGTGDLGQRLAVGATTACLVLLVGRELLLVSQIIAGPSRNSCRCLYHRRVGHHPHDAGVLRGW
jgi:hypothetical protein